MEWQICWTITSSKVSFQVEREDLLGKLESAEAKLSEVSKKKCAVVLEKSKVINVIKDCMRDYNKSASIRNFLPSPYT